MLEETVSWLQELTTFERNIFKLCFHIGVEVVKFAPAKECLRRLREHTLNWQELAPLIKDDARLNQELSSCKRVTRALQIRQTIQKLTLGLPTDLRIYKCKGAAGLKWARWWPCVWKDAATNKNNPFYSLWQNAKRVKERESWNEWSEFVRFDECGDTWLW